MTCPWPRVKVKGCPLEIKHFSLKLHVVINSVKELKIIQASIFKDGMTRKIQVNKLHSTLCSEYFEKKGYKVNQQQQRTLE